MTSYVRACWDFEAQSPDEVSFTQGMVMTLLRPARDGWIYVQLDSGPVGYVPENYVEACPPPSTARARRESSAAPAPAASSYSPCHSSPSSASPLGPLLLRKQKDMRAASAVALSEVTCPLALDVLCSPVQAPCGHIFSEAAISQWLQKARACPLCTQPIPQNSLRPHEKMAALVTSFLASFNLSSPQNQESYYLVEQISTASSSPPSSSVSRQTHAPSSSSRPLPHPVVGAAASSSSHPHPLPTPAPLPRQSELLQPTEGDHLAVLIAHASDDLNVNVGDIVVVQIPDPENLFVTLASDPSNSGFIPVSKVGPFPSHSPSQQQQATNPEDLLGVQRVHQAFSHTHARETSVAVGINVLVTQIGSDGFLYIESEHGSGWVPAHVFWHP